MSEHKSLLIEIGADELPVAALPGLARALFVGVGDALDKRGIAFERDGTQPLYTPRRLAVLLPAVATEQPEQRSEVLGPYLDIALDADGEPTRALQGFARKAGVDWTRLERMTDNKGERFVHRSVAPGARTRDLLPEIVHEAVAAMPIRKPMRWGDHDHAFARPLHWLVLLLGDDVVDGELFGIRSDRMSRGHRFMHDKTVWIARPEDYVDALRGAKVLVDPDERRERIVHAVETAAQQAGVAARIDAGNLEQVNCLVEWPSAVSCSFDPEFLAVPHEALIATMETHQKFFPMLDADGRLSEHFVGIANIEPVDDSEIRSGYERVIRPRFADARFFFVEDMKQSLASMNAGLDSVTYQAKLGSVADKVARVAALAEAIAAQADVDPQLARRAAELSKADLQSRLVNEFPELQGVAGRYYAVAADESIEVANAIDEAYRPRFAGDGIASSRLGQVLAIAERLDTLAGGFAAGLKPSGNKDPFALRRNALGLARTIIESGFYLDVYELLYSAVDSQPENVLRDHYEDGPITVDRIGSRKAKARRQVAAEVHDFILDRLRGYYADQGVTAQQFEAVASVMRPVAADAAPTGGDTALAGAASVANPCAGSLLDFDRRIRAIGDFARLPEADALAAANKRIRNILKKAGPDIAGAVDTALLTEPAERELHAAIEQVITETANALAQRDYVAVLDRLSQLRPQVDAFFDNVMVNVEDTAVRNNRLALLKRLSDRLGSVAAIEHLST